MKRILALLLALTLTGCAAQGTPYDLAEADRVMIAWGDAGEPVLVTEEEAVAQIKDNFASLKLKKQDYSEPSVLGYTLIWLNTEEQVAKLTIPVGESWVSFGGQDYSILEGSIDTELLETQLAEHDPWGITLTAKDPRPNGVTIVCEQSGGMPSGELSTGSPYWLEVKKGEVWEDYPAKRDDIAWTMEGWGIPRNGAVEWLTNWEGLYGELPAGTYRIGKTIMDWRAPGDYDERACYAEFTIA